MWSMFGVTTSPTPSFGRRLIRVAALAMSRAESVLSVSPNGRFRVLHDHATHARLGAKDLNKAM